MPGLFPEATAWWRWDPVQRGRRAKAFPGEKGTRDGVYMSLSSTAGNHQFRELQSAIAYGLGLTLSLQIVGAISRSVHTETVSWGMYNRQALNGQISTYWGYI
jgi:hypothetical protein